ncbi:MAG TPA: hypothetical protein VLD67_14835 [Vicinamibacterales bacterium]|nr:hypothetical protein [Vicinamibacterales bacterium]
MRHATSLALTVAALSILVGAVAWAQQPAHQHDADKPTPGASSTPSASGHDMHAHMAQHMEMCRQMMGQGGMMGGGMMGMPTMMMGGDPKQQAEMMAMRGEMMKAMGEIMLKYAQRAQAAK